MLARLLSSRFLWLVCVASTNVAILVGHVPLKRFADVFEGIGLAISAGGGLAGRLRGVVGLEVRSIVAG